MGRAGGEEGERGDADADGVVCAGDKVRVLAERTLAEGDKGVLLLLLFLLRSAVVLVLPAVQIGVVLGGGKERGGEDGKEKAGKRDVLAVPPNTPPPAWS